MWLKDWQLKFPGPHLTYKRFLTLLHVISPQIHSFSLSSSLSSFIPGSFSDVVSSSGYTVSDVRVINDLSLGRNLERGYICLNWVSKPTFAWRGRISRKSSIRITDTRPGVWTRVSPEYTNCKPLYFDVISFTLTFLIVSLCLFSPSCLMSLRSNSSFTNSILFVSFSSFKMPCCIKLQDTWNHKISLLSINIIVLTLS